MGTHRPWPLLSHGAIGAGHVRGGISRCLNTPVKFGWGMGCKKQVLRRELCLVCRYRMRSGSQGLFVPIAVGSWTMLCWTRGSIAFTVCIMPCQSCCQQELWESQRNCYSDLVSTLKPRSFLRGGRSGMELSHPMYELSNFPAPKHQSSAGLVGVNHFKNMGIWGEISISI